MKLRWLTGRSPPAVQPVPNRPPTWYGSVARGLGPPGLGDMGAGYAPLLFPAVWSGCGVWWESEGLGGSLALNLSGRQ